MYAGLSEVEVTVTVMFQNGNPVVNLEYAQDSDCFNILVVEVTNSTLQYGPFIPIVREQDSLSLVSVTIDSGVSVNEVFMITVIPLGVFGEGNSSEVIHFSELDCGSVGVPGTDVTGVCYTTHRTEWNAILISYTHKMV